MGKLHKATARACANIALVKYWGKSDEKLRLPVNSSAAVCLDKLFTRTTVEFLEEVGEDAVEIKGGFLSEAEKRRVSQHLDRVRALTGVKKRAKVNSENSFAKASGLASSASSFAALSLAAAKAAGLNLSEKELSILARQGSGSACRSIPGGMVIWQKGKGDSSSYAYQIFYPADWKLRILLVLAENAGEKSVSSSEGMKRALTSPYFALALKEAKRNVLLIKTALSKNDWKLFGKVVEDECFRLHILAMTSSPSIVYWQAGTLNIIHRLLLLREKGIVGFFTIDAGPHVHVVCQGKDVAGLKKGLAGVEGVERIVDCKVGGKARLEKKHLF